MARAMEVILADLDALTQRDFDVANPAAEGWGRLERACAELRELGKAEEAAPVMFGVMERLDAVDLGSPGPLVHTMERWSGRYELFLAESVRRKPSYLAVWMVNRILNADPVDWREWMELLRGVEAHPLATEEAKGTAQRFLKYQRGRGR